MKKTLFIAFMICIGLLNSSCIKKEKSKASTGTISDGVSDGGNSGGDTGGGDSGGGTPSETDGTDYGVIFVSLTKLNGSGSAVGHGQGLSDFDSVCQTEAQGHGLNGTFKALLSAGTLRRACSTASCSGGISENVDWPLKPNEQYRRLDKSTVIGTTNGSGIFEFPLTSSITDTATDIWTGMSSTLWTTNSTQNCSNFATENFTSRATIGNASAMDEKLLTKPGNDYCDQTKNFLCAQIITEPVTPPPAQEAYRVVFMTSNNYAGGSSFKVSDGVIDFDNICKNEATAKGLTVETYKALIQTNGSTRTMRRACYTAGCQDGIGENSNWIFEPNTEYRREDKLTIIGTTNAEAIFDFPLENGFTGTSDEFWTGFPPSWAILNIGANSDCAAWTVKSSSYSARVGKGDVVDGTAVDIGSLRSCDLQKKILCVEQKRAN